MITEFMNYHCPSDIKPDKELTVTDVMLFQRFRQAVDVATVSKLIDDETNRHIRLCEMTVLYYASCGTYWTPLPYHALSDITNRAVRLLRERGFAVECRELTPEETARDDYGRRTRWHICWSSCPDEYHDAITSEWMRRERLEDEERAKSPPVPMSEKKDNKIHAGEAIWAAELDRSCLVEVQRIHGRNFLCVFDTATRVCLSCERTMVSYGAMFGPDAEDVAEWQRRATEVVDSLRNPPRPSE